MKQYILGIMTVFALFLTSCGGSHRKDNPNIIYIGYRWDVIRVNDSTVICAPGLNASSESAPVVIKLSTDYEPKDKTDEK